MTDNFAGIEFPDERAHRIDGNEFAQSYAFNELVRKGRLPDAYSVLTTHAAIRHMFGTYAKYIHLHGSP